MSFFNYYSLFLFLMQSYGGFHFLTTDKIYLSIDFLNIDD